MKPFLLLFICGLSYGVASAQVKQGQPAPELSLPDLQGQVIPLSQLKGKVVLIDFWASWCGPCRRNNPRLAQIYKKYRDQGLEIYGVSIDARAGDWREAVEEDKLSWLQVNDNRGWNAPSIIAYNLNAIPSSFLIDKKGVVREIDLDGHQLEKRIRALLKE